jgi:hypothetical protein
VGERDPVRIWIEVKKSTMNSAKLGLFILPLDADRKLVIATFVQLKPKRQFYHDFLSLFRKCSF